MIDWSRHWEDTSHSHEREDQNRHMKSRNETQDQSKRGAMILVSALALAVWGGVLYRVGGLGAPEAPTVQTAPATPATERSVYSVVPEYSEGLRDAFRPPQALRLRSTASDKEPEKPVDEPPDRRPPEITLSLAGIVDGVALLTAQNGGVELVPEGQTFQDHKVVDVGDDYVIIERDTRRDTVRLHPRRRGFVIQ